MNRWIWVASSFGALGVVLGAFGAHGLKARLEPDQLASWQTAVQYHLLHAVALLGLGLFAAEPHARTNPDALLPVRRMIFLTDGAVANEGQMIERLARGLGHVRLHTFGIGYAPNRALMRKMAAVGGGLCTFIASEDFT